MNAILFFIVTLCSLVFAEELFFASVFMHGHAGPLSNIAQYMHKHFPEHHVTFASELPAIQKLNLTCATFSLGNSTLNLTRAIQLLATGESESQAMQMIHDEFTELAMDEYVALYEHFVELKAQGKLPKLLVADMGTMAARVIALDFGLDFVTVQPSLVLRQLHKIYQPSLMTDATYPVSLVHKFKNLAFPLGAFFMMLRPMVAKLNDKRKKWNLPALGATDLFSMPSASIFGTVQGFDYTFDIPPNHFTVGSLVPDEYAPLTDDLNDFLAQGPTMYVSFGSVAQLSPAQFRIVQAGIEQSQVRAIWVVPKAQQHLLGNDTSNANIKILAWAPQLAVLAHPNTTLFITHCGGNSVHEGLHFGKALIGMPFAADQVAVADRLQYRKVGLVWNRNTLTASQIADSIRLVFTTPAFSQVAQHIAKLIRYAGGIRRAAQLIDEFAQVGLSHVTPLPNAWYEIWYLDILASFLVPLAMIVIFWRMRK